MAVGFRDLECKFLAFRILWLRALGLRVLALRVLSLKCAESNATAMENQMEDGFKRGLAGERSVGTGTRIWSRYPRLKEGRL